jgi:hypothetical protein
MTTGEAAARRKGRLHSLYSSKARTDLANPWRQLIPKGIRLHERQDRNGDAPLQAGVAGPCETVPVLDGPYADRHMLYTVPSDR